MKKVIGIGLLVLIVVLPILTLAGCQGKDSNPVAVSPELQGKIEGQYSFHFVDEWKNNISLHGTIKNLSGQEIIGVRYIVTVEDLEGNILYRATPGSYFAEPVKRGDTHEFMDGQGPTLKSGNKLEKENVIVRVIIDDIAIYES